MGQALKLFFVFLRTASKRGFVCKNAVILSMIFSVTAVVVADEQASSTDTASQATVSPPAKSVVLRLVQGKPVRRQYPRALPTLIKAANQRTTLRFDEQPRLISSFENADIFKHPFIYVNYADREDWTLSTREQDNLRKYLRRGGFLLIDAGINAEFLREKTAYGQHHSFGEWRACPTIQKAFESVFPDKSFEPLDHSHELYRSFYSGLPDPEILPESVREFVVQEKWPQGTYSAVALRVNGRIAVLATPIIAMGWGKDSMGNWVTNISFRIREGEEGLSGRLEKAAYTGRKYQTQRRDGMKDTIYCQKEALPAWVQEPDGQWRVFRYYRDRAISEYAHTFYTRLGINILVYALTH